MVELKIVTDVDEFDSEKKCVLCSARILCILCNEYKTVSQHAAAKKDGPVGCKKWVLSNFESHLKLHITKRSSKQNIGTTAITKLTAFFTKPVQSHEQSEKVSNKSISGEASSGSCQERILLEEKKSSHDEKIQEAGSTKTNEVGIAPQVTNSH